MIQTPPLIHPICQEQCLQDHNTTNTTDTTQHDTTTTTMTTTRRPHRPQLGEGLRESSRITDNDKNTALPPSSKWFAFFGFRNDYFPSLSRTGLKYGCSIASFGVNRSW